MGRCYHRGMKLQDKIVVVTGGGNGIGRALCRRFAVEGARAVIVADIEEKDARAVAAEVGGWHVEANMAEESEVQRLVDEVLKKHGQIDLFCSNAGIGIEGDQCVPDGGGIPIWDTTA